MLLKLKNNVLTVAFALLTAVAVSFAVFTPALADFRLSRELVDNCANYNLSKDVGKNITIDIDNKLVSVSQHSSGVHGSDAPILLPLSRSASMANYNGCSAEATKLLVSVQESYDRYITGACTNFKAIVSGEKPLDEKNGEKANMKGAVQFVEQHCQI